MEDNTLSLLTNKKQNIIGISSLGSSNPFVPIQSLPESDLYDSCAISESSKLPRTLVQQKEDYLHQRTPTVPYRSPSTHFQTSSPISTQDDSRDGARCRYCNTKMSSMLMLKLHEESIHGALDRHRCSWCSFGCDREENLFKHILESHPQRPLSDLECILCRKRFKKKSYRNKHFTRCHFRDDSNKYQIPSSYRTKYQKCVECDIWFRWVEDYNSHLKQFHSTTCSAEISITEAEQLPEITPVEPECEENNETEQDQNDDAEIYETNEVGSLENMAYMCCGCNIGFPSEEKLLCHVNDTHE